MLLDGNRLGAQREISAEVAVVGAGPAGIVTALELARGGVDVLLVESGGPHFSGRIQRLSDAASYDAARHAPMADCTRRQIGGASVIWGGRCLPYDPIDFEPRPWVQDADWPIGYGDVAPYFQRACDWFRCGRAVFDLGEIDSIPQKSIVPGLPDGEVRSSELERWSLPTDFGREYHRELKSSRRLRLLRSTTCTEIEVDASGRRVVALRCRVLPSLDEIRVTARASVLACGGLDTTRLLLASDRVHRRGIGNGGGQLGRHYMGHISGRIAQVRFTTPPERTVYGFDRDVDGTYLRRRFTFSPEFQREQRLPNIVSFLVNPDIADPAHRNGVLSFSYLALASPLGGALISPAIRKAAIGSGEGQPLGEHLRNVLFDPWKTLAFVPSFGYRRYLAHRKVPGFFQRSASNTYPLHYHGEHLPNSVSRVSLSEQRDELGMRRLDIDLRYDERDVDGVLRAHRHWDAALRKHGCGSLEYLTDDPERSVWEQAGDGFHQVGTTRMSRTPESGVVGTECNVHGMDDLFVASSSNFVTSGQANSTFTIVALALRLADHLRAVVLPRARAGPR